MKIYSYARMSLQIAGLLLLVACVDKLLLSISVADSIENPRAVFSSLTKTLP